MKKIKVVILALVGVIGVGAQASFWSAPVKPAIKAGEKVAAKIGFKGAAKAVARGGAKLAAVTAEREAAKTAAQGSLKAIAKEATAKKILAVGAATTMVASGHEVADGVQESLVEMGRGVGKAAEEDPEVAASVAGSLTGPVRSISLVGMLAVIAGALVLLGLAFWFFWPWVLLARNISARAANRKAAAMSRSGFTRVEVIFAVLAFLVLTILGVLRMATRADVLGVDVRVDQGNHAKRAAAVAALRGTYAESIDRHYRNFLSEVEHVGNVQFDIVRSGIPGVAEKFGTYSRCKDLFVAIVSDQLKDEDETGASIKRDLEADYYRGLYAARDRVYECLAAFVKNAESAKEAFQVGLEAELDFPDLPGDDAYKTLLETCGELIEQKKDDLKWGQIDAGISTAIEAACIRQTVAAVARILGKTGARQAGTMVAGAGAAAADGPSPICDAVACVAIVGCTAWSAWDVYQATTVLPEELRTTLESATQSCERQTLDEVKEAGKSIYDAYLALASAFKNG